MDYKESSENLPENEEGGDIPIDLDEELDFQDSSFSDDSALVDFEQLAKKAKGQGANRFSLRARRAIEDHLEQRRLRKELDYMFDDDFVEGDEEEKPK